MKKKEALDFLELPDNASDIDISERVSDKLNYFERLSENAPNDFLKKLHFQNIEKVKSIRSFLLQETAPPKVSGNGYAQQAYNGHAAAAGPVSHSHAGNPVAFLVRHTENRSAITFPLYSGKNLIGRSPDPNAHTIIIDDDAYVSRQHAIIEVYAGQSLQMYISDDSSQGKASKNGTYINGNERRITKKTELRDNDTVQIGMTKLILRYNNTSINKIVNEVEESEFMKTVIIDIF
jgi:hypothetical protein